MTFEVYLKTLREEYHFSQSDLARAIGVSRQCVSKWELGINKPKIDKLVAISECFDIDISNIIKNIT